MTCGNTEIHPENHEDVEWVSEELFDCPICSFDFNNNIPY